MTSPELGRIYALDGDVVMLVQGDLYPEWFGQGPDGEVVSFHTGGHQQPRPLVVIDPEDRQQTDRLSDALAVECLSPGAGHVQNALRRLANPKPEEPTNPRARVADRRENIWRLLADGDWVCTSGPDIGEYLDWSRLASDRGPLTIEVTP